MWAEGLAALRVVLYAYVWFSLGVLVLAGIWVIWRLWRTDDDTE